MSQITINWHIIQRCNYTCDYCFAKYDKYSKGELHNSKEDITTLLKKVYSYFSQKYSNYSIRLNIAGGEPTLCKNLEYTIKEAYNIGFEVSLISNASRLSTKFIEDNAKYISMFAVSVDSVDEDVKKEIGRVEKKRTLSFLELVNSIELFRKFNSAIEIKINTVVNRHNYKTNLSSFIERVKPKKWKVLQAVSLTDEIYCNDEQYQIFLKNHSKNSASIYKESNEDMQDSYIMLDPYGRFYQNSGNSYNYSDSILTIDINEAFNSIKFDIDKFNRRYLKVS